jgi:hypothetical protein
MKSKLTSWEKTFSRDSSKRELIPRIPKESCKLIKEEHTTQVASDLNKQF